MQMTPEQIDNLIAAVNSIGSGLTVIGAGIMLIALVWALIKD